MTERHPNWEESSDRVEQRLNDQTLSDLDQKLSDRDQSLSDSDQRASDEEQAAADLGPAQSVDSTTHARTSAGRADTARERVAIGQLRQEVAVERDEAAQERDEHAARRDRDADLADERWLELASNDTLSDRHTLRVRDLRARGVERRKRATHDHERAARDRMHSARDRQLGALDREEAKQDRERSSIDELTGVKRRGVGLEELGNEMKRARREGNRLVAAYVDVDGLKYVNDEHGHAAGDELLKTVAEGLRHHTRSYDLLVRLGGDEFLCAMPNVTSAQAQHRFDDLRAELKNTAGSSVSVGLSELRDDDSPDDFVARADGDLLARRVR